MPTKPGSQTIAFTSVRIIAADIEIGRTSFERCFPALAQIPLVLSSRVIEQSDIGVSYLAVELGRQALCGMETRITDGSIQVKRADGLQWRPPAALQMPLPALSP